VKSENYANLKPRKRVLFVLRDLGGEQSVQSINAKLNMKSKNLDSLLSRLFKEGKIERVSVGVYKYLESENS